MLGLSQQNYMVLRVASVERSCRFYSEKLGVEVTISEDNCKILNIGSQKIKLKQLGQLSKHHPRNVFPGSAEICLLTKIPLKGIAALLINNKVALLSMEEHESQNETINPSIFIKDPDGNLLIITNSETS